MVSNALLEQYGQRLVEVVEKCNQRFHSISYLFGGIAFTCYFLTQAGTAQLQFLGASIAVPQSGGASLLHVVLCVSRRRGL
jgi:hypothetical protein